MVPMDYLPSAKSHDEFSVSGQDMECGEQEMHWCLVRTHWKREVTIMPFLKSWLVEYCLAWIAESIPFNLNVYLQRLATNYFLSSLFSLQSLLFPVQGMVPLPFGIWDATLNLQIAMVKHASCMLSYPLSLLSASCQLQIYNEHKYL